MSLKTLETQGTFQQESGQTRRACVPGTYTQLRPEVWVLFLLPETQLLHYPRDRAGEKGPTGP